MPTPTSTWAAGDRAAHGLSRAIDVNEAFRLARPGRRAQRCSSAMPHLRGKPAGMPTLLGDDGSARELADAAASRSSTHRCLGAHAGRHAKLVETLAQAFAGAGHDKQKLGEAEAVLG